MNKKSEHGDVPVHYLVSESVAYAMELAGLQDHEGWRDRLAESLWASLSQDLCPRCRQPFVRDELDWNIQTRVGRADPEAPSSVPICARCEEDEQHEAILGHGYTQLWAWPVSPSEVQNRTRGVLRLMVQARADGSVGNAAALVEYGNSPEFLDSVK